MFLHYGFALSLKKLLLSTIIGYNSVFTSFQLLQPENANLSKAQEPSSFFKNSALDFRCIANLTLHDWALHLYQALSSSAIHNFKYVEPVVIEFMLR